MFVKDVGVMISIYLRIGGGSHPMVPTKALASIVLVRLLDIVVGNLGVLFWRMDGVCREVVPRQCNRL